MQPAKPKLTAATNMRPPALKRAQLASTLINESVVDFLSAASDARALPILKEHKVKLPKDAELAAT